MYIALVSHNTGHGVLTEVLLASEDIEHCREALRNIDTMKNDEGKQFSFGEIDTGVVIYDIAQDISYPKYGAEKWESWKPAKIFEGLKPDDHGYGNKSAYNPNWILWDKH